MAQVDPELPRPAAAAEPVGQRRALGAAAPPVPAHHRVPLAGGPHRPRHRATTPPPTPSGSSTTSTPTSWSNVLAIPVLPGRKTAAERFPGAINTLTVEAMMGDGKALQMGTSHELGQNFAKVFDITYLDDQRRHRSSCWTTSWGVVHPHGRRADHGPRRRRRACVVPPALAPDPGRRAARPRRGRRRRRPPTRSSPSCKAAGVRVRLDAQVATSFGRRATDWELKGVPVRIEVGPRDLAEGLVTLVRRDTGEKRTVPVGEVAHRVADLLDDDPGRAARRRHPAPRRPHRRGRHRRGGRRGRPRSGFARIPWDARRGRRRGARSAQDAITVRCLQTPGRRPPRQRGRARPRRLRRPQLLSRTLTDGRVGRSAGRIPAAISIVRSS